MHGREVEETSLALAQGTTANLKLREREYEQNHLHLHPTLCMSAAFQERRLKILRISTLAVAVAWLSVRIFACFQMSPCCVFI